MVEIAIVEAAIVVIELESYLEKIEVWQAAEDCIKAISRDGPTSQTFEQATEEMERTEE